jgi:hypothetical protein
MISTSNFIHLPYTRDLTEGGIAYALHSLPHIYNRSGGSPCDHLRRVVAGAAVELAFRRCLSERDIPFDVKSAAPFTDPERYDVSLAGHRCEIKSFLISDREQISEMKRNPGLLLHVPALVASDENAAEGNLNSDIYLFAFLSGLVTTLPEDFHKVHEAKQPHYLVHVMPDWWVRPEKWTPLGKLALKSDSEESQILEIGGQDAGREMRSLEVEIPPRTRIEIDDRFFSLASFHIKGMPKGRLGVHSPVRRQTYIIGESDWGNIWVYGMDILLAGYLRREEFNRKASFLREGARVFQYERTRTKNLAVSVSDLKPISELFERVKEWNK